MINFLKENKLVLIPFLGIFVLLILFVFIFFKTPSKKEISQVKPLPIPTDYTKDYSNLYRLVPGKSTLDDVKKINGAPYSVTVFGENTYLYYKTPLNNFINKVLIKNNRVVYSYENVFGTYRGTFSDFINSYGQAPLEMYVSDDPYAWSIYPDKGIGVESDKRDILVVIYFVPTTKEGFIKNLAPELKLLTEQPPVSE